MLELTAVISVTAEVNLYVRAAKIKIRNTLYVRKADGGSESINNIFI